MASTSLSTGSSLHSEERARRLQTVRRVYFYLVVLIASTAALYAVGELLGALAQAWLGQRGVVAFGDGSYLRRTIASSAGILVVSAPLFLVHWRAIGATLERPGERGAGMRKFFLYVASAIALTVLLVQSAQLIEGVAFLALGGGTRASRILPSVWLQHLGLGLTAGLLLFYWQWALRQDGDFGVEEGSAAVWRQIFLLGATLAGLALLVFGSAGLVDALLRRTLDVVAPGVGIGWFARNVSVAIAQLLVGAPLARTTWSSWRAICARNPDEESTILWRLFLYVAVIGGALATLIPATIVLRRLLLWAFDALSGSNIDLLIGLTRPLAFVPAGILIWRAFAAQLRRLEARDAALEAEGRIAAQGAAATVRRIYHYAVAATGLVLLWIGAVQIVQVLLDALLTASTVVGSGLWRQPLANGLSLVAVGAPVWAIYWRTVQSEAGRPAPFGPAERSSLPRRVYLYGVCLAGALVILFFLAQVLYRFFLVLMGDAWSSFAGPQLAEDLARSAIAAILWGVHLFALRADMRLAADEADDLAEALAAARPPAAEMPLLQRRADLEARLRTLEAEAAGLRAELAALDPPPATP